MDWYEKLEKVREFVCDEEIITAMGNYFNSDQMEDFVNELIINYDLDSEFPDDEDYGYDIETCGAMFPDWFPIPETHNIHESSMMNEYKQFFEKYFNK